jgi:hypothetical protein
MNIETLIRRRIITVDPSEASTCCGLDRDSDGFCQHRPNHPIYLQRKEIIMALTITEDTLNKVFAAMTRAGLNENQIHQCVTEINAEGVMFGEELTRS